MQGERIPSTRQHAAAGDTPGSTIRFILSSTFRDFQTDRIVLQERVFPELRQRCAAAGFRLQPIDLRWWVSEAAGTERETLAICFDERARCRVLSPDCFLLILLGERYGSCLLPPAVPAALGTRLLPQCSAEERATFAAAYRLDENASLRLTCCWAPGERHAEHEALRQVLVRAVRDAGQAVDRSGWPVTVERRMGRLMGRLRRRDEPFGIRVT